MPQQIAEACAVVHRQMFSLFTWTSDKVVFGEVEKWHSFFKDFQQGKKFRGDCDDFMLTSADALIDLGVDARRLSAAVCKTERGDLHAVLIVDDELVLDNRYSRPMAIQRLPYTWVKSMSGAEPGVWRELTN